MDYKIGDIVETKKPHPCGSNQWEILRVGLDFKLKCKGCSHVLILEIPTIADWGDYDSYDSSSSYDDWGSSSSDWGSSSSDWGSSSSSWDDDYYYSGSSSGSYGSGGGFYFIGRWF